MVCALTAGKKAYAEWEAQTDAVRRRASALQARFLEVIDLDTEAFCAVSAAYALPKATDEEKGPPLRGHPEGTSALHAVSV